MQSSSESIVISQGYSVDQYREYFSAGRVAYEGDDGFILLVPKGSADYMVVRARDGVYSQTMKRMVVDTVISRDRPIFSDIDGNHKVMFRLVKKLGGEVFPDNTILFR